MFPSEIARGDKFTAVDGKQYLVLSAHRADFVFLGWSGRMQESAWKVTVARKRRKFDWYVFYDELPLFIDKRRVCGSPCCWKHYREIGEGDYRCQNHWMVGTEDADNRSLHKNWRRP